MKLIFALLIAILCSISGAAPARTRSEGQHRPEHAIADMIPDGKTAVAVAKVLLIRIYGANVINKEMPLVAVKKNGIWIVEGTMKRGWLGGVATIKIRAADCQVLYIWHGK